MATDVVCWVVSWAIEFPFEVGCEMSVDVVFGLLTEDVVSGW